MKNLKEQTYQFENNNFFYIIFDVNCSIKEANDMRQKILKKETIKKIPLYIEVQHNPDGDTFYFKGRNKKGILAYEYIGDI